MLAEVLLHAALVIQACCAVVQKLTDWRQARLLCWVVGTFTGGDDKTGSSEWSLGTFMDRRFSRNQLIVICL
jgi:hypothetical protein